jgi:hypothetical protein
VWEVSVKRDFEENMVWDNTSFHGFSYSEEYEEYEDKFDEHLKSENKRDCDNDSEVSSQVLELSSELDRSLKLQNQLD